MLRRLISLFLPRPVPAAPRPRPGVNVPTLIASGTVRISPAAWEAAGESCIDVLERYLRGDWGSLNDADREMREAYLLAGYSLMAAYACGETRLHVLTDGGLTQTTLVAAGEVL